MRRFEARSATIGKEIWHYFEHLYINVIQEGANRLI